MTRPAEASSTRWDEIDLESKIWTIPPERMGFAGRLVSHGLRSLASTTLNEQGFESNLIEAALAHVDDNQVRSAYNRTDYLERRIPMMSWWSAHIEEAAQGSLSVTGTKQLKVV